MKLYANIDLHDVTCTLDDDHVFQGCRLDGANITTAGFGLSIEDCRGEGEAPEYVVNGVVRQL